MIVRHLKYLVGTSKHRRHRNPSSSNRDAGIESETLEVSLVAGQNSRFARLR